jgi:DNA-binding NarL/FixJ family response regulator
MRVLLVDDQEMIRSGLALVINAEPDLDVVGQASSADEAVAAARSLQPDVVVMDVQLGTDDTGVDAATEILLDPKFQGNVLILTTFDDDEAVTASFKAGVSGFLLKQSDADELLAAIRVVGGGGVAVDQAIVRRLMTAYPDVVAKPIDQAPASSPALDVLTTREREVLELVANGKSNAEIADSLVLSLPTVKTHIRNILFKLGVRDRLQAALIMHGTNPQG